jgi:flagellar biosynthetic protein FliR
MTAANLQQLVHRISATQVTAFFLLLARVAPLFFFAPMFSSRMIPSRVRTVVAVALAIGLTGVATHGERIPTDALSVGGLVLEQLLVGGALAFALGAMFAAVQTAGSFLDATAGFSFGAMLNPLTGTQDAILAQLYALVGTAIFIAVGGDAWVLHGLARTLQLVPLGGTVHLGGIVSGSIGAFNAIFTAAIEVAAPVMLAVLITDIAFGMVSRVVPQLNVFAVGFPVKIGVALIMVTASLPFLGGWFTDQLAGSVSLALRELGGV